MIVPAISLLFCLLGIGIAIRANSSLQSEARLPMQWSVTGKVNWTAPRTIGISFFPAVTIGALALIFLASLKPTKPGQEELVIPILLAVGTTLIALQLLHLWLVSRNLRRHESRNH
jgi:hypothetical protein